MVAEPVQATLGVLRSGYAAAVDFINIHSQKLPTAATFFPSELPPDPGSFMDRLASRVRSRKYEVLLVAATAIAIAAVYRGQNAQPFVTRRRAPKLPNGARREMILVVGSPTEPLTRLLALDLEKRGFIVYLTLLDEKDRRYVAVNGASDDVNYLDLSGDYSVALGKLRDLLNADIVPLAGAKPHKLHLAGILCAPTLYFPVGPAEHMPPATWERVTDRLQVYTNLVSLGLCNLAREQNTRVVCVIPSIVGAMNLTYHAPEAVLQSAVRSLFATIAKELRPHNVQVTQVLLGNLNIHGRASGHAARVVDAEVRSWPSEMQLLYGASFLKAQTRLKAIGSPFASQTLKGLHYLLFDLITGKSNPLVVYYGAGARTYDRISAFLPASVLDMILS